MACQIQPTNSSPNVIHAEIFTQSNRGMWDLGQAKRYFPMPDYDLDSPNAVKMTLYGHVVDQAYSRLLIQKTNLSMQEILALDRVQKGLPLQDSMIKRLRRAGLVEGRKPNLHVSASVAKVTASKANYIKMRAQDDDYYCKLVTDFIKKFGRATRGEIDNLLQGKLSEALDDEQKTNKISNLINTMRRNGQIKNFGSRMAPDWRLAEGLQKDCRKKK